MRWGLDMVQGVGFGPEKSPLYHHRRPISISVSPQLLSLFSFLGGSNVKSSQVWREMKNMNRKIINCPHCGKALPDDLFTGVPRKKVKCTACGSQRNWKDGMRKTPQGNVQRYLCRDCGTRFTEH